MSSVRRVGAAALASGLALLGLGVAMVVVAATGDSLFYVKDTMTLPLIASGAVIALLGIASLSGVLQVAHVPSSAGLVGIAIVFLLIVRPGPLSVDAGFGIDITTGERVKRQVVIPPDAIVGVDASPDRIAEHAVELHAGQIRYAVEQAPDGFERVAVRMIGQVDVDDDGDVTLVRFWISCCAADALRLVVGLDRDGGFEPGTWVEITGQWDGVEQRDHAWIDVASIAEVEMPERPYLTLRDS